MRNRGYLARPEKSKSCSTRMYSEGILAFTVYPGVSGRRTSQKLSPDWRLFFEQGKVSCYLFCVYHRARKMNPKFQIQKYGYVAENV